MQVIVIDGGVKHVISYIREEVQVGQIVQKSSRQNGWEFFTSGKLSLCCSQHVLNAFFRFETHTNNRLGCFLKPSSVFEQNERMILAFLVCQCIDTPFAMMGLFFNHSDDISSDVGNCIFLKFRQEVQVRDLLQVIFNWLRLLLQNVVLSSESHPCLSDLRTVLDCM